MNDVPEKIDLDRHIMRVTVPGAGLVVSFELRNASGRVVQTVPAKRIAEDFAGEFNLRQVPGSGDFTIRLSPSPRSAPSRLNGSPPALVVLGQSSFWTPGGSVRAVVVKGEGVLRLRLDDSTASAATGRNPPRTRATRPPARDGLARHLASGAVHRPSPEFVSVRTKKLDNRLWSGFSAPAIRELEAMKSDAASPRGERIGAAWALARWHANRGAHDLALGEIQAMHAFAEARVASKMVLILETVCLLKAGRAQDARSILERSLAVEGFDADLCLQYANCFAGYSDGRRLEIVNSVYRRAGFATVARKNPNQPVAIGNLCAPDAGRVAGTGSRVSVIVPVYNAQATIGIALDSLVEQTWPDVEIIVVDDCSRDGTWDIVRGYARAHANVVAVRQDVNQGAYAARNRGLELATGDLITTHDADDWSHPQQIEAQARRMATDTTVRASRSHWVRATDGLQFVSLWRSGERLIHPCWPSFMFTREVANRLGAWDRVRAQADSEFIDRTLVVFGNAALTDVEPDVPLAFSLVSDVSLTGSSATSISTVSFGLRRDYQEASRWWRSTGASGGRLKLESNPPHRPFPAPASILPDRPARPAYDLLLVADTNTPTRAYSSAMAHVGEAIDRGDRVAIFHWPDFDSYGPTHRAVWSLAHAGKLDVISAGEEISAETVLIADPSPLRHPLDRFPVVTWKALRINADRPPPDGPGGAGFNVEAVEAVVKQTFGGEAVWKPVRPTRSGTAVRTRRVEADQLSIGTPLSFDVVRLAEQKQLWAGGDGALGRQVAGIVTRAEEALVRGRLSVVDKSAMPPSGDRHDYMTVSPYWWPDPKNPDGPQVQRRDGIRIPAMQVGHPDSARYDYTRSRYLFADLAALGLAHFFTGEDRFAAHAAKIVRTWFVDPETRMNPNLNFAQARLGHDGDRGTAFGLLEFRDLHFAIDAIRLLAGDLDEETRAGLRRWLRLYLDWLTGSALGKQASATRNNHGPWYDLQVVAIANDLGDDRVIASTLERARSRIGDHFESDGRQPNELSRTLSQHYCAFNLQGWMYLAQAAEVLGTDLWHHRGPYGAGLREGLLWLLDHDGREWPYQQMEPFDRTRLMPLCEAYRRVWPASELVNRILAEVPAPDDFDRHLGIRPFWRIGFGMAEAPRPDRFPAPAVSVADPGFIADERLRRNEPFNQFLAFGFTFNHEVARDSLPAYIRYRAAYRRSPDPSDGTSEADGNVHIDRLLMDAVREAVASAAPDQPITLGLSSGFDSRPILHAAMKLGIRPVTFTYGQIGNLDFDLSKDLSQRLGLDTILFDTSEMEWSLVELERAAAETQDVPISPRVMAKKFMDDRYPDRIELHGHLNGVLTGAASSAGQLRTWIGAVHSFAVANDFFGWQKILTHIDPINLLPAKPFADPDVLPYHRQIDLGYRQAQRIRPRPDAETGLYKYPYENGGWLGFWLNRTSEELAGQRRYLRFVSALNEEIFRDIAGYHDPARSDVQAHRRATFYGAGGVGGLVDLARAGKDIPRPDSRHVCLHAAYNNNPSFRRAIDASIGRLRKRNVFTPSFIDSVVRAFAQEVAGSDPMLNGLVSVDLVMEVGKVGVG